MVCLGKWGSGGTPKKGHPEYYNGDISWLMISDLNNGTVTTTEKEITKVGFENSSTKMVPPGTVFVGLYGSIGKCAIAGIECCTNQAIGHCIPNPAIVTTEYLFRLIQALAPELFDRGQGGAQKNISQTIIKHLEVALPPLAEQRRIVAKVDELMALLDELERTRDERDARRAAFRDSALAALQNAEDAEAAHAAWSRIATNLADCITDPADIAPLRQTILQLAVRGRLVPQDPEDEPAEKSVAKARKLAGLATVSLAAPPEEAPFDAPPSWTWTTVGTVASTRLGKMLDKAKNSGSPELYLRNTNVHWFRFELDNMKVMLLEDDEVGEFLVQPGDVLICEGGHGIGRTAVWSGQLPRVVFQKALHRIRPLQCLNSHFLTFCAFAYQRSGFLQQFYTGAGIPHFTGKSLAKVPFPLPPVAEQRRIVAKVDELMTICDELEQRFTEAKTHQSAFAAAAVHHLDLGDTADLSANELEESVS